MLGVKKDDDAEDSLYEVSWGTSSLTKDDEVFFLSARELADYVGNYNNAPGLKATNTAQFTGQWWLRSPRTYNNLAGSIPHDSVSGATVDFGCSARPAFNLNLNSVLFISAAGGSAQTTFGAIEDYTGNEWKVTLKDGNSFTEGAGVDKTALAAGETLTVTHKALSAISSDYTNVTAMLTNSSGELLYYGSINGDTSVTSSAITIPAGLAAGEYTLYVYGEDWNGANMTDYATGTPFKTTIRIHSHSPGTDGGACFCGYHPITSVTISGTKEWGWSADAEHCADGGNDM